MSSESSRAIKKVIALSKSLGMGRCGEGRRQAGEGGGQRKMREGKLTRMEYLQERRPEENCRYAVSGTQCRAHPSPPPHPHTGEKVTALKRGKAKGCSPQQVKEADPD